MDSILTSVKKLLGISEEYTHFDADLVMHINSVFMVLNQLGVGPSSGFSITGKEETWGNYLPADANLDLVKSYVYQKVKLLFDPPQSSSVLDAMKRMIDEFEWRLQVEAESPDPESEEDHKNGV